jgi:hypothetical protein
MTTEKRKREKEKKRKNKLGEQQVPRRPESGLARDDSVKKKKKGKREKGKKGKRPSHANSRSLVGKKRLARDDNKEKARRRAWRCEKRKPHPQRPFLRQGKRELH